jgi:predicted transcriptional regulator
MCEENKNNEKKENPETLFELLNSLRKKREETPSEKILKLALERDKVYDRCKSLSAEIKEAKEKNQDYNFLTIQFNHMDDYKKVLGDQIKKLIDET